ncbi:unnamed protein product [Caenorhabditis angaria]|uniref:Uncharacterized protein n=1 Tax=Caenorhabditis angaria TaxID=860376 RepID=A0A9P1I7Q4_9PELO|nr:unnamed protein product [Caenorhabditis angaria]
MWKIIIICLCFVAVHSNSDSPDSPISVPPTVISSSSSIDIDKELAEIASSCLTKNDNLEMVEYAIGPSHAALLTETLIKFAVHLIAYSEMRAALGLPPPGPWKHYIERSKEEFASATPEEYFEFKEESNSWFSLDSEFFMEKNFPPVIRFLDKRFPAIRKIFKHRFNNIHRANPIDRKTVDAIWNEYSDHMNPNNKKMNRAIRSLVFDVCPDE